MNRKFKNLSRKEQIALLEDGFYSSQLIQGDFVYHDDKLIFSDGVFRDGESIDELMEMDVTPDDLERAGV